MEILTREELLKRYSHVTWISPYQEIFAMIDSGRRDVELHEFHARGRCIGGSAWELYHYPRISSLITSARREGARNIFKMKVGTSQLNLRPGIAGAGIESVEIQGDEVHITYAGLAGGGIAATVCRGMARGVKKIEIHERGGGAQLGRAKLVLPAKSKVVFGVDDTDRRDAGATWSLVNEVASKIDDEGLARYLRHTIVQLYVGNPYKTTNGVSIAAEFAVDPLIEDRLIERFKDSIEGQTMSGETGVAIFRDIDTPPELKEYTLQAKTTLLSLEDAVKTAQSTGVDLLTVTGERGLIGALAAIGMVDDPDEAVKVFE